LNKRQEAKHKNFFLRFSSHFHNILIYVLLVAAAITASLGHFFDTFVIITMVIINALIGFFQERMAEKSWMQYGICLHCVAQWLVMARARA
jgi:magnesium-transporting ATPase (P-type)